MPYLSWQLRRPYNQLVNTEHVNKATSCHSPEAVRIDTRQGLELKADGALLAALQLHCTIKHVLDWCLAQSPVLEIADMVTQDEYTHDFIVPYADDVYFVYDTT